jgi:predicted HicB family RNase H-like nuclease
MPESKPKPKKVGRPKLPKGSAKAGKVQVRLSPAEQKQVEAAAKMRKQSVSEWVRSLIQTALEVHGE